MARSTTKTTAASVQTEAPATVHADTVGLTVSLPPAFVPSTGLFNQSLDLGALPAGMVAYLIQYGLSKSLQDAASGTKAKAEEAHTRAKASGTADKGYEGFADIAGIDHDAGLAMPKTEFADRVVTAQKSARLAAIVAGTVGASRGTPKAAASPLDREMIRVAGERLRAAAAARGTKLPKGPDFAELVVKYQAKYGADVRAEAERRLAAPAGDLDIAELLGDLPV